jgi:acetate kinase
VFAVLYMMERCCWSVDDVRKDLTRAGGLAGLSGVAGGDVRDIEKTMTTDACLALEVFAYQVKKTIGAYAAAMGGLDAVAFTGGIGENSARLRAMCCAGLEFLGITLDPALNESGSGDRVVSRSPVAVHAIATNEELIVARRAYRVLA